MEHKNVHGGRYMCLCVCVRAPSPILSECGLVYVSELRCLLDIFCILLCIFTLTLYARHRLRLICIGKTEIGNHIKANE